MVIERTAGLGALCAALFAVAPVALRADGGAAGFWAFEDTLRDGGDGGHHGAMKGPGFAEGREGRAFDARGAGFTVGDHPDLRLGAGLTVECWVRFDRQPTNYQHILVKDQEYQLRVDGPNEGGRFSFFVHTGGWEPRVTGPVPEPNRWHHIVARWTGTELELDVDGRVSRATRVGNPSSAGSPLVIGSCTARIDSLSIRNPTVGIVRDMRSAAARSGASAGRGEAAFGGGAGWEGWSGLGGAVVEARGPVLAGRLSGSGAFLSPALSVELTGRRWVSIELEAAAAKLAVLAFLTDGGEGTVMFPVRPGQRTMQADLSDRAEWRGTLRRLSVSFPDGKPREAVLRGLWVDGEAHGSPFLYLRSLSPFRAVTRAGREEKVLAIARNLGVVARGVRARIECSAGVELLDAAEKILPDLTTDSTVPVEWRVRSERAREAGFDVTIAADGCAPVKRGLRVRFEPPCGLPAASYVPEPVPATPRFLTLMHYCPLWKEGTHYGWERIEPWPERRPAIGYYDEGTPEVADWHIKHALEHGIQGFIYCWYRDGRDPEIQQQLGHALHDGLLKARYRDRFKFAIMWENGCGAGCRGADDLLGNLVPYWMTNYFTHPSYVKVDGRPLLFIWVPGNVTRDLGGSENVRGAFEKMRAACRAAGLEGLHIVGCVGTADRSTLSRMAAEGWDASSAYGLIGETDGEPGQDAEGIATIDHGASVANQERIWRGKKDIGALPDIVDVMMGWDPRPWHGARTARYLAGAAPEHFEAACRRARSIIEATGGDELDRRMIVFDNWNEFGEGHYLEPCTGFGFGFADAIRRVFCDDAPAHEDIIPEDVGLAPPERAYMKRREILGGFADRPREPKDGLIAAYTFDNDDDFVARDASACGFDAVKSEFKRVAGWRGDGFLCQGGTIAVPEHALFFPRGGITVELRFRTDVAGQSDRWMLNTVGESNTGYRLGFGSGRVVWQVPKSSWSHSLACPDPAPLGRWTHVAATYDGQDMRLFIDGVEKGALRRGGAIAAGRSGLCVGSHGAGNTRAAFQGAIDEVRIWDRALSGATLGQHARQGGDPERER